MSNPAVARLDIAPCPVPRWLPGGHAQTLATLFSSYHKIHFVRDRVETPDGDFLDFDWSGPGLIARRSLQDMQPGQSEGLQHGAAARWMEIDDWTALGTHSGIPALILFHGLEGSSASPYAQSIAQYFRARGWIVVIPHFRGCSGTPNRLARAYHSGDSEEIDFMLASVRTRLPQVMWHAAGVSLGGNALLKYLGEQRQDAGWLTACAAISAPVDLVASGRSLGRPLLPRHLYSRVFLKTMKAKVLEKARRFPGVIDILRLEHAYTLQEFDDAYTAPMHGFRDVLDYWTQCSAKPLLGQVTVPTLIINARNDPFLPAQALPVAAECAGSILLHQPDDGGHAVFPTGNFPSHQGWLPQRLGTFFETGL